MNKNTIIGSILIVAIMIWWMASSAANADAARAAEAAKKAAADSVAALQSKAGNVASSLVLPVTGNTELKSAPVLGGEAPAPATEVAADSASEGAEMAPAPKAVELRTVSVETDKFTVVLTNKGAKIQSVIVKALADSAGKFPELIQDTELGALDLKLGPVDLSEVLFDAGDAPEKIVVENNATVEFVFTDANGSKVVRSYGFSKDGAAIRQVNKFVGFRVNDYELSWKGGMKETEELPKGSTVNAAGYFFSEVVYNNTDYVERETIGDSWTLDDGKLLWAGLRRKYVAMTVQFDAPTRAVVNAKKFKVMDSESDPGTYSLVVKDELRADSLAYNFMVLPLQWDEVESYGVGYEKIIATGSSWFPGSRVWFVWICKMLLKLLNLFYALIPNYGVAIILITILVRAVTTPFTVKQMKSTAAMSKLKPQMDEISVKYRSDPQKRNAAMLELYQKEGVNPMATSCMGCLPVLLQMPVFMGLFFVLGRAVELRGMPAFLWITDLSKSDVVIEAIKIPFLMPNGFCLLPIIMLVTMIFQTKVTMQGNAAMDPAQQKMMMWMMPAMMFLFSAVMPSGLLLYWTVSNIWVIVQYKILHRNMDNNAPKTVKGKKVQDAQIVK